MEKLDQLEYEVTDHPSYSLDLAPSDFYLFPKLKIDLKGTHFANNDAVINAVTHGFRTKTNHFCSKGYSCCRTVVGSVLNCEGNTLNKLVLLLVYLAPC